MTSLPDKHFRDHLEHFKKSPPPAAWSRIESGLDQKKSNSFWLSIAATLLVLLCASFLLWHAAETPKNTPLTIIDKDVNTVNANTPVAAATPLTNEPTSSPIIKPARNITIAPKKSKPDHTENSSAQEQISDAAKITSEHIEEKPITPTAGAVEISSSPAPESIVINDTHSSTARSNKITYSSGEVNSRFLKKDTTTSIPSTEKTSTGIQKIRDLAADLKEEATFGELRQMKNEILSFPIKEFTKDK